MKLGSSNGRMRKKSVRRQDGNNMNFLNKFLVASSLACVLGLPCIAQAAATTIAVPDLGYKEEVRTFFYYEAASSHANATDKAHVNAADSHISAAGAFNRESDSSYVKTYHDQVRISYGELRGMASGIRALLIKNGYSILTTSPHVEKAKQQDDFFDINKRIKAGEFAKAQYVLYGVVASVDYQDGVEPISRTDTQMNIHALNMVVDFNLIDVSTLKTTTAFTVFASANDNKLGAGDYPPSPAKIVAQLGKTLSDEVASKLSAQNMIHPDRVIEVPSGQPLSSEEEKPVTVYRPD
jgi:hypothetical protein